MDKKDLINKWNPVIESMGITGSRFDWMSQYCEMHEKGEQNISFNSSLPSLLPISIKAASKTIGFDLVSVKPMGYRINIERRFKIERILCQISPIDI
jgi:hypothetical protein